ncbi:MAG: sigma 54-interacting transcriptional regulator, partial [Candidatus Cloacimonadaceae bacterium]|nr:sigma 54-interacting transcriptional regulator [Candidatus Cloacimonadaceae bacterium]
MHKLSILILDDEPRIREELRDFLQDNSFGVQEASCHEQAMSILESQQIDIAIVDLNLPGMHGLQVLEDIKAKYPEVEVLIITGQGDMDSAIRAMRFGAADFFNKPIHLNEVLLAIQKSSRFVYLNRKISRIQENYDRVSDDLRHSLGISFVGSSPQSQQILQDIHLIAQNPDTPVMICGESGTGKELVARSIHYLSSRQKNYFNAVNCAAIPDNLFESEFFGYERGAFTGANISKPGWFE